MPPQKIGVVLNSSSPFAKKGRGRLMPLPRMCVHSSVATTALSEGSLGDPGSLGYGLELLLGGGLGDEVVLRERPLAELGVPKAARG